VSGKNALHDTLIYLHFAKSMGRFSIEKNHPIPLGKIVYSAVVRKK